MLFSEDRQPETSFLSYLGKKNAFTEAVGVNFMIFARIRHPLLLYIDSCHVSLFHCQSIYNAQMEYMLGIYAQYYLIFGYMGYFREF